MASQSPFTRSPSLARSRPTLTRGQVPRYAASSAVASDFQNETGPKGLCLAQMTKNPPRFFRAAAKLQQGQNSSEHTHTFTRPRLSKTPTSFPVGPPYHRTCHSTRQIRGSRVSFHRLPDSRFFQRAYSTSLPVFPLFLFRKTNRQVRGSDRPKLANLSDNTTAHFI